MANRIGIVSLSGEPVGTIEEIGDLTEFTYSPEWLARPHAKLISLTMRLRAEPYISKGLHPFFENLLPEGWYLELCLRVLKLPREDQFGLLLATCADCIGAVEIVPLKPNVA